MAATAAKSGHTPRSWLADLGSALVASPKVRRRYIQTLIVAVVICGATIPFAGWELPSAWLAVSVVLVACDRRWQASRLGDAPPWIRPFEWLISCAFSTAAFYLVLFHGGPAQTLGVTLYGVMMFQILARDYVQPRRLIANLLPPIVSMAVVQVAAVAELVSNRVPWEMLTLIASPYVVYRAFRLIYASLQHHLAAERKASSHVHESESRYRLIAESSPDVILRYDLEGRVEYLSPAARHYGWDPDNLTGVGLVGSLHPDEFERNAAFMADLAAGRPTPQGRENIWRTRTPDGREVSFEGRSSPVVGPHGRVIGAVAVMRDVTERLSLEDELRRKRAEAEAASLAKSEFLATVSHEIRTPLNGVLGMAQAMAHDQLPERQRERLEVISRSGETLLALLNDILDLSKIEAGKLELENADIDLAEIVDSVGAAFAANAEAKGLALTVGVADGARGLWRGDAMRLRQVLSNLVSNAVKFTEVGEVAVWLEPMAAGARFVVSDTGVGIEPGRTRHLFQKFVQADSSTTRRFGGTGLGLAICAELCRAMGGDIRVETTLGVGSAFTVEAPLARAAPGAAPGAGPQPSPTSETTAGSLRVLAAEDNRVNQLVLQALLGQLEIAPVIVETGAAAVDAWERQSWDLILMDVQMPVMDGPTATREIRAREAAMGRVRTPIIALTANAMTHQLAEYLAAGMDAVVAKPINIEELFAALQKVADDAEAQPLALAANG